MNKLTPVAKSRDCISSQYLQSNSAIMQKHPDLVDLYQRLMEFNTLNLTQPSHDLSKDWKDNINKTKRQAQLENTKYMKDKRDAQVAEKEIQRRFRRNRKKNNYFLSQNKPKDKSYRQIYQNYIQQSKSFKNIETVPKKISQDPPKGISYYDLLKKHPKIVAFTLQKIKTKSKKSRSENYYYSQDKKPLQIETSKNKNFLNYFQSEKAFKLNTPQNIVKHQMLKIYSKRKNEKKLFIKNILKSKEDNKQQLRSTIIINQNTFHGMNYQQRLKLNDHLRKVNAKTQPKSFI